MAEKRKDADGRILPDNVVLRKDGTYMWKKMIDGKQYCEYAKTLGEIKQKRNKAIYEIEQGTYRNNKQKKEISEIEKKESITVDDWFNTWIEVYRKDNVKLSTLQANKSYYKLHVKLYIGNMRIKDVKQVDIIQLIKTSIENGISKNTAKKLLSVVNVMFLAAVDNEMIKKNPCPANLPLLNGAMAKERIPLTEDEEKKFIQFLESDKVYNHWIPYFDIALNTGMRVGELTGLTWDDVDLNNRMININHTLHYSQEREKDTISHFYITTVKTKKSNRNIPMSEKVYDYFVNLKDSKDNSIPMVFINGYSDFVFKTKFGYPQYSMTINNVLKNIIKKMNKQEIRNAKLENREPEIFRNISSHILRHTFATKCYHAGLPMKAIQDIMGHEKAEMTLSVYTHNSYKDLQNAIQLLEKKQG